MQDLSEDQDWDTNRICSVFSGKRRTEKENDSGKRLLSENDENPIDACFSVTYYHGGDSKQGSQSKSHPAKPGCVNI